MLGDLRREIERIDDLPEEQREGLRAAVLEIEASIEKPPGETTAASEPEAPAATAGQGLADRALALEAAHPSLTEIVDRVMRQLSRMGI